MRILDEYNNELNPKKIDLAAGYLKSDTIVKEKHKATKGKPEKYHYETVTEYENGGKEVIKIIDEPGEEPREAWTEYEEIQRYIKYTPEELKEKKAAEKAAAAKPTPESNEAAIIDLTEYVANLETTIDELKKTIEELEVKNNG